MIHGLAIFFGLTNPDGHAYLFWSGVAGSFGYVVAPLVLVEYWRRNTCDILGCRRLARRKAKDKYGDTHSVCVRHALRGKIHPDEMAEALADIDERAGLS